MKRSDISDRAALEAAHRGSYDNALGPLIPISEMNRQNVWERLRDLIGPYPWKVGWRKMEQLEDRGWIEYGTSLNYAWRTPEGNEEFKRLMHADLARYGICRACHVPPMLVRIVDEQRRTTTLAIGCGLCVLDLRARDERERFVERLQAEGDTLAAQLETELDLPEGTHVVFELEDGRPTPPPPAPDYEYKGVRRKEPSE